LGTQLQRYCDVSPEFPNPSLVGLYRVSCDVAIWYVKIPAGATTAYMRNDIPSEDVDLSSVEDQLDLILQRMSSILGNVVVSIFDRRVDGFPLFLRKGDARTEANGGSIALRIYAQDDGPTLRLFLVREVCCLLMPTPLNSHSCLYPILRRLQRCQKC
jgi:hypothetical protein